MINLCSLQNYTNYVWPGPNSAGQMPDPVKISCPVHGEHVVGPGSWVSC